MILAGIIAVLVSIAGLTGYLYYARFRPRRVEAEQSLYLLDHYLKLSEREIHKYPVRTLSGRYFSFPVAVESIKKQGRRGDRIVYRVVVETESNCLPAMIIQSAIRPGKVTHLYGQEVVLTDDAAFDRKVIVVSDSPERAKSILTDYIRSKLSAISEIDFMIDLSKKSVLIEVVERTPAPRFVAGVITTTIDLCHAFQLVS